MQTLNFDEFLQSPKQNVDAPHSLLVGAGASVESGVPSASYCIWEWKREILLSQNTSLIGMYANIKVDNTKAVIQRGFDSQRTYPPASFDIEYSFYAEKVYPIADEEVFSTFGYRKEHKLRLSFDCNAIRTEVV